MGQLLPPGRFPGKQDAVLGNGAAQGPADFRQGVPHHIRVVPPHIGYDADIRPQNTVLGGKLELRLERHTFNDQDLGALPRGLAENPDLFLDIGLPPAHQRLLVSADADDHGVCARGFAEDPQAACPQTGVNQAADCGFPPDAIDVDHMGQLPAGPGCTPVLPQQITQPQQSQSQNKPRHGLCPLFFHVQSEINMRVIPNRIKLP